MKKIALTLILSMILAGCSETKTEDKTDSDIQISDFDMEQSDDLNIDNSSTDEDNSTVDIDESSDSADEIIENDNNDEAELVDEDSFIPECTNGASESADCETTGKQMRTCVEGSWSDFGECIDITAEVIDIAGSSDCASVYWADRGDAPAAYIKGMGLTFAGAVCNITRSDVAIVSQAKTDDLLHDALAWYDDADIFSNLGMSNDTAGIDTLRHAYTLLIGLGMRESSGEHCCGRDTSASNTTAETAEAGLFQTSYNSHSFSTELDTLYSYWKDVKALTPEKCLLEVFSENVTCNEANWENFGVGEGVTFQALEKECPIFAAEYAAVMLRLSGGSKGHYGPLRRHEAEVRTECDTMLGEIQQLMTDNSDFCQFLVNY